MTGPLDGARILLGVSGSIAAYKSAELARLFKKRGADVQVVMTEAAQRFITPTTLHALTGRPVLTDLWALGASAEASVAAPRGDGSGRRSDIEHVEQAHGIDLFVVAPATANTLARIACGLADDVLAAIALATRAPMLVAPAMEPGMWEAAATRENCARLAARGVAFVGPAAGELASGRSGVGRMSEPEVIVEAAERLLAGPGDLAGERVLVTAGPTWEAIDPVRVLSNRSTGAMGIAIAEAAAERGADVTLVLGPTMIEPRATRGLSVVRVESAREMLDAGRAALRGTTVLIATAAVSDFRPEHAHAQKLKRSAGDAARAMVLVENPDVLATLSAELRASSTRPPVVVGFAAETEALEDNARLKLEKKRCDLVIANLVGPSAGFGPGQSAVIAVPARGAPVRFGPAPKAAIAQFVLDQVRWVGEQVQSA